MFFVLYQAQLNFEPQAIYSMYYKKLCLLFKMHFFRLAPFCFKSVLATLVNLKLTDSTLVVLVT